MKTITITSITAPVMATGTLTASGTPSAGDTVTIGTKVYTFKATPTVEGDVKINGQDGSLTNLAAASNHSTGNGTNYVCAAKNADVSAGAVSSHAIVFTARTVGGNSIATTETSAALSWGNTTLTGGDDTTSFSGTVAEVAPTIPSQQVTVEQRSVLNPRWSRALRMTSQGAQVLRFGVTGVAITADSLAQIAVAFEPLLTWSPLIITQPAASSSAAGNPVTFSIGVNSELTPAYAWQVSSDGTTWTAATGGVYSDETTAVLSISDNTGLTGKRYRCVVTTAAGTTTSATALLTVTA